jgi:hypothetical protein
MSPNFPNFLADLGLITWFSLALKLKYGIGSNTFIELDQPEVGVIKHAGGMQR